MMVDPSAGNEIHVGVAHDPDGEEDQSEADQVAEQRRPIIKSERDAGGAGDDRRRRARS